MIKKELKNEIMGIIANNSIEELDNLGFVLCGETNEGVAFQDENGDTIVIKIIAKKDDFDLDEAIATQAEKKAKAEEKKAAADAKKQKAKESKAKAEQLKKEKQEKAQQKKLEQNTVLVDYSNTDMDDIPEEMQEIIDEIDTENDLSQDEIAEALGEVVEDVEPNTPAETLI